MPKPYPVINPAGPDNPPNETIMPQRPINIGDGVLMIRKMVQNRKAGTYILRVFENRESIELSRLEGEVQEIPLTPADCE